MNIAHNAAHNHLPALAMKLDVLGHTTFCHTGNHALERGRPTIVLMHGVLNAHLVWLAQAKALTAQGWNVLAPDLPGHLGSGGTPPASVEAAADFLLGLLDAAGVEQAVLAGHSFGSLAALEAAARAPERVSHLVLIGTAYPMKVSPSLLAASLEQTQEAIDRVARYSHSREAVQAAQQARPQAPSPVDLTRTLMQQVQASNPQTPLMHIGFQACNQYLGGEVAMEKVLCPTLFLLGRQDVMTPPEAVATLQTRAGRGQTALIDSGHALMSDNPDGMMAALRDFLPVAPAR